LSRFRLLSLILAVSPCPACGSRTTLDLGLSSEGRDAASDAPRDDSSSGTDASRDTDALQFDAGPIVGCPSALLPGAPRAMFANCSTRDMRSRVFGPTAPHVTWVTPVIMDASGRSSFVGLAADASGSAYLVVGDGDADNGALVRVDAATGIVQWTTPFEPLPPSYMAPLLLSNGALEFVAAPAMGAGIVLDQFNVATGQDTPASFPLSQAPSSEDPAVGADGSLYVAYPPSLGSSDLVVSRLSVDATTITWTTPTLRSLLPSDVSPLATEFPSTLALGLDGLVIVPLTVDGRDSLPVVFVLGLDPTRGSVRWVRPLSGQLLGGPAVAKDGSIAILLGPAFSTTGGPEATSLVVLEPSGEKRHETSLGALGTAGLLAVAEDGTVLIGTENSESALGYSTLLAVDATGQEKWTLGMDGLFTLTIDERGTIFAVVRLGILGLDPTDGHVSWSLHAPRPGVSVLDLSLTSSGGIVAEESDGTVFGASD
jgi:outer membrane protein assembly factor BamB